jgi:hypothetical protein
MSREAESAEALAWWDKARKDHRQFLLTSPEGHAVAHIATNVIRQLTAEIMDLRSQEDERQGRTVTLCLERDRAAAVEQIGWPPEEGHVIRYTDTLRELVFSGGRWTPREDL